MNYFFRTWNFYSSTELQNCTNDYTMMIHICDVCREISSIGD